MTIRGPIVEILSRREAKKTLIKAKISYLGLTWIITAMNVIILEAESYKLAISLNDPKVLLLFQSEDVYYEVLNFNLLQIDQLFFGIDDINEEDLKPININVPKHVLIDGDKFMAKSCIYYLHERRQNYEEYLSFIKDESLFKEDEHVDGVYVKMVKESMEKRRKSLMESNDKCAQLLVDEVIIWPQLGSVHQAMFPCYPGSGSKWALSLIQGVANNKFFDL